MISIRDFIVLCALMRQLHTAGVGLAQVATPMFCMNEAYLIGSGFRRCFELDPHRLFFSLNICHSPPIFLFTFEIPLFHNVNPFLLKDLAFHPISILRSVAPQCLFSKCFMDMASQSGHNSSCGCHRALRSHNNLAHRAA